MKKIGIVAEYNPFHNGHLYQIQQIKEKIGEEILIIGIISGNYVQRGEISYLDKFEKTNIALENGIDLIIELPLYYSIQNAEIFCKMSTKILDYIGVDIQVFGAEEDNLDLFYDVINFQNSDEYRNNLLEELKKGNNYIISQKKLLEKKGYGDIVKSNNILGLEYLRTIKNENLKIKPYIIKREISEYNEVEIENNREVFASATYIRKEIIEKNNNGNIKKFLPKETYEIIQKKLEIEKDLKFDIIKEKIFKILKYKILTNSKVDIMKIYDMSEEIYAKIYKGFSNSQNYFDFIENVKSRNISIKRIERILLNALLNIEKENIDLKIDYVRVLGFNEKGKNYIKELKKLKKIENIFTDWKNIEKQNINNNKIKIEKNGFLIGELLLNRKEKLNPIIKN